MTQYKKLIFLITSMTMISLSVAGSSIYILYKISLKQQQERLQDIVITQGNLIDSMSNLKFNNQENIVLKREIINVVIQSKNRLKYPIKTVEFTLAEKIKNQIIIFTINEKDQTLSSQTIPWDSPLAEPSRKALQGISGSSIELDYQGQKVLAAYHPITSLNLGLSVKINLSEIRYPYFKAALFTVLIAIILDIVGGYIIFKVHISIIKELENSENQTKLINQKLAKEIQEKLRITDSLNQELELLDRIMELNQVGIILADSQGNIILANDQAERILGLTKEEMSQLFSGVPKWRITDYSGNLIPQEEIIFKKILQTRKKVYDAHYAIVNGQQVLLSLNAAPIFDEKDQIKGIVYSFENVTKRVKFERELHRSEALFRAIFEKSVMGIAIVNLKGKITKTNSSLQKMLGYSAEELENLILLEIFDPNDIDYDIQFYHQLLRGKRQVFQGEKRFLRRDQNIVWGNFIASLVNDVDHNPQFIMVIVEDITQRKQSEEDLKESEEKYRRMIETANEGVWIIDEQSKTTFVNERMAKMLGYEVKEMIGLSLFDFVDFQDKPVVNHNLERRREGIAEQHDFKFTCKDGSTIWTLVSTNPIFDSFGNYTGSLGLITNITERKKMEQQLSEANQKLKRWVAKLQRRNEERILLSQMNDFLQACLNKQEAYNALSMLLEPLFPDYSGAIFISHESQNWVEVIASWGEELHTHVLFSPQDCWGLRRGSIHYVKGHQTKLFCQHFQQNFPRGESLCIPMMAQGKSIGLLYLASSQAQILPKFIQELGQEVAEKLSLNLANLQLRETLKMQSIRDPLTGLFNRRYLEESLEREIYQAQRQEIPVGIIMIDIDHFKRFNDNFGHDAGDLVLRETGEFLRHHIRGGDIPCRYGGEELTLILPGANLQDTQERAEEIRQGIKQLRINYQGQLLSTITVSLGVACFPQHGNTGEKVIQIADQALYQAKEEGRDRVVVAS